MSAFYKHAASILEKAQERSSSLKALVLSAPIDSKSQLMATVCQVLQCKYLGKPRIHHEYSFAT